MAACDGEVFEVASIFPSTSLEEDTVLYLISSVYYTSVLLYRNSLSDILSIVF